MIRAGEAGGRQAAAKLHAAIVAYIQCELTSVPWDARVVCRVYANVRGLAEVLVRTGVVEEISPVEEFVRGFTRGRTLFDFVDVGPGKDRADEKLIGKSFPSMKAMYSLPTCSWPKAIRIGREVLQLRIS